MERTLSKTQAIKKLLPVAKAYAQRLAPYVKPLVLSSTIQLMSLFTYFT